MKDNPDMRDYPERADADNAYALLWAVAFIVYAGITFALGGHTFLWFLIGAGGAVGFLVLLLTPIIVYAEWGNLRWWRKSPEVHRAGPIPGAGGLTYEKQDAWLRELHRRKSLRYQFGYLWYHLRHPEHWGLINDDPDRGCNVETRAQLESSTTKEERDRRSVNKVVMWLCVLTILPCVVGTFLFFPMLMISISRGGMSMWKLAGMAYVGTALIVAGCHVRDRIAIRARRRAQRRAILT